MLWPLVTPFVITIVMAIGVVVISFLLAPVFKLQRRSAGRWAFFSACILFVPAGLAIKTGLDKARFGNFEYAESQAIDDHRVVRFLVAPAVQVSIQTYPQGFKARFRAAKVDIEAWHASQWHSAAETNKPQPHDTPAAYLNVMLGDVDWPLPNENVTLLEYRTPYAPNGAGSTVWFDPKEKLGYQIAGYW